MDMERTWTWMWTWTWGESRGGSKPGGGGERQGEEDEVSHLYAASKQTHLPSAHHTHVNYRAAFGRIWTFSRQTNEPCLACGTGVASSTSKPYASSYSHAKTRCKNVMHAHRCTERCMAWPRPPFRAPYGPQEPTPRPHGPFPHPFPSDLAQPALSSPHESYLPAPQRRSSEPAALSFSSLCRSERQCRGFSRVVIAYRSPTVTARDRL